jgi:hypothetical protein
MIAMRKLLLAISLFGSLAVMADSADLQITTFTTSKTAVKTGEPYTVVMRWRNAGPDIARGVVASVNEDSGSFVNHGAGSEHWVCEPTFGGDGFACKGDLAVGAEAELIVTMLAPSTVHESFSARGRVSSFSSDPSTSNNVASQAMTQSAGATTADLVLGPETQTFESATGAPLSIPLSIRNDGPSTATDIYVALAFTPGIRIPITASGAGWTCQSPEDGSWIVVCRRPQLAAGETSLIVGRTTAPEDDGHYEMYARIAAVSLNDAPASNTSKIDLRVGEEAVPQWTRILVPLPPGQIPGNNGALWTTKTTALLRSQLDVRPGPCETIVVLCPGPASLPVMQPFDLAEWQLRGGGLGEFVFVRSEDAQKIRMNSRVWDAARETETAGSEIPIAREDDFVSTPIHILGIPVGSQYRHTLRIYDLDGHANARVRVRIYANDETISRTSTEMTLTLDPDAFATTTDFLSTRPASIQLDPLQLGSLSGASTMHIEVTPIDEGVRLWSFVSVTNNETNHVTTFSGQ